MTSLSGTDLQDIRDYIKELGDSIAKLTSRQYGRAQDAASDALEEAGDVIRRNPLVAMGVGLGVGFGVGLGVGFLFGVILGGRN
jgi:ElaB/YqjD/DUF883 family membrane-anchored ribosome-binding protein